MVPDARRGGSGAASGWVRRRRSQRAIATAISAAVQQSKMTSRRKRARIYPASPDAPLKLTEAQLGALRLFDLCG